MNVLDDAQVRQTLLDKVNAIPKDVQVLEQARVFCKKYTGIDIHRTKLECFKRNVLVLTFSGLSQSVFLERHAGLRKVSQYFKLAIFGLYTAHNTHVS